MQLAGQLQQLQQEYIPIKVSAAIMPIKNKQGCMQKQTCKKQSAEF